MNQAHIDSLREQLNQWERNLSRYRLEDARYGGHPPQHIVNDISAAEQRIKELQRAIDAVEGGAEDDGLIATYNSIFAFITHLDRELRELQLMVETQGAELQTIKTKVDPPVKVVAGRTMSIIALIILGAIWAVPEVRLWMFITPVVAVILTLALPTFAVVVRWLPEE